MAAAQGKTGTRSDPFGAFLFAVSVGSARGTQVAGGFAEASGLTVESEIETFRAGGINDAEVMLPGPAKWPARLTLRRGLGDARMLWAWYCETLRGAIKREEVTIALRMPGGQVSRSWVFHQACPIKWIGPDLQAGTSAVSFEAIELVHRGCSAT